MTNSPTTSGLDFMTNHASKDLLRFVTAGSVDDGKSTLIGRLLYESHNIYEDQLDAVRKVSDRYGNAHEGLDLALVTDGLKAEREQGITIDVAYRYFSTPRRKFIIADTPGHVQYTRNTVTGASTANLMVLLVDVTRGILTQTRRHAFVASLLGIRHLVVAVNKMDLVGWSQAVFDGICNEFREFSARLDIPDITFIPLSARLGDNVVVPGSGMPWYRGTTLLNHLETIHIASDRNYVDLRLPVQLVLRPDSDFRGYLGTLVSGTLRRGETLLALPSRETCRIQTLAVADEEVDNVVAGQPVCLTLDRNLDLSRGDMLVRPNNQPRVGNRFEAMVVWLSRRPLVPGRTWLLKHTTLQTPARVETIHYEVDMDTLHRKTSDGLELNQIGRCSLVTTRALNHDPYSLNRGTGSFILIDRTTNETAAAGMILPRETLEPEQSLRGSGHREQARVLVHSSDAPAEEGAAALEQSLRQQGRSCFVLSLDRGWERLAEDAALLHDAGVWVLIPMSPDQDFHRRIQALIPGEDLMSLDFNSSEDLPL